MRRVVCCIAILAGLLHMAAAATADAEGYKDLQAVLLQVERLYLERANSSLAVFEMDYPDHTAAMIGLVLQGQKQYIDRDPSLKPAYDALQLDVQLYLFWLAAQVGYFDKCTKSYVDADTLWKTTKLGMDPKNNRRALELYKVDPDKVAVPRLLDCSDPFAIGGAVAAPRPTLAAVPANDISGDPGAHDPAAKLFADTNAVTLLGVEAPEVRTPDLSSKQPSPPIDRILGEWVSVGKVPHRLTIRQTGPGQAIGRIQCAFDYRKPVNDPKNKYNYNYKLAIENDNALRENINNLELTLTARTGLRQVGDYDVQWRNLRAPEKTNKTYAILHEGKLTFWSLSLYHNNPHFMSGAESIGTWQRAGR